jgi:dihydrofolate reductase
MGVESAVEQVKAVAGGKVVSVGGGASLARQCLRAGLLDEIQIHLAPLLLGDGVRLFDDLGHEPIRLEQTRVIEAPGITHARDRVVT